MKAEWVMIVQSGEEGLRGDLTALSNSLKRGCDEVGVSFFCQITVIGQEGMASRCTRGGSSWISEKLLRESGETQE